MCAVDGKLDIIFVPHVNRQEVYAGQRIIETPYDEFKGQRIDPKEAALKQANVSPVNFFMPKQKNFPLFAEATRQLVNLEKGDCVFIPAFEYYQISGNNMKVNAQAMFNNAKPKANGEKKITTVISLHF
jgi:hypothetical protein